MNEMLNESDCKNLEAAAARTDDAVKFSNLPRTSALFTDFLYDYQKVAPFYADFGRKVAPLAEHARQIGAQAFERGRVADALERINRRAGSPELTFQHIELLRREGTVAIVTGQQAGLFTGPLYTIYKALTVIKLAACLRQQGVAAAPVFWIASEDHDYEEVNHTRLVDREGQVQTVRYEPAARPAEVPVGRVQLDDSIHQAIEEFLALLPPSEFVPEIAEALRASYQPGAGFADAFARLLAHLFRDYGVILLDPGDEGLKQVAAPLYAEALEKSEAIAAALVERSRALEAAGYHAQVNTSEEMVPLFILDENRRTAMTARDGRFYIKGTDKSFDKAELVEMARRCPNCFSPNVTLRPVVQDFLLPTAAYVGGPAEIAYFAQLRATYEVLGRQEPCVLPRASFTVIEGRHQKTLEKYNLQLTDFFDGLHAAITKVVEQSLDRSTAAVLEETESLFNAQLDKLEAALEQAEATLADSLRRSREKILYQIEHLRTRFIHASMKREETAYRQLERAYTALLPNKNFQERELNIFYFLSRYGQGLIDELYNATEIGYANHKLLYIGGAASQVVNAS